MSIYFVFVTRLPEAPEVEDIDISCHPSKSLQKSSQNRRKYGYSKRIHNRSIRLLIDYAFTSSAGAWVLNSKSHWISIQHIQKNCNDYLRSFFLLLCMISHPQIDHRQHEYQSSYKENPGRDEDVHESIDDSQYLYGARKKGVFLTVVSRHPHATRRRPQQIAEIYLTYGGIIKINSVI